MEATKKTKDEIQAEALKKTLSLRNAGVEISMGVGKTLLGLMHMDRLRKMYNKLDMKFLVVAPKRSIFQSWIDEAEKNNMHDLVPCITFSTYMSLKKQSYFYDAVYLDECHSLKESHDDYLFHAKLAGARMLGLTGTYPKFKSSEKAIMCNKYCPKVYVYKTDSAVEDKILNDYRIYVHKIDLSREDNMDIQMGSKTWKTSELKTYQYWSSRIENARTPKDLQILRVLRMKAMMSFKSKEQKVLELLARRKTKTLLFANTQEQADRLAPHSFHSNNPQSQENLRLFKAGDIDLLSAVEQLSEGVTIPNLKSGIIMHAYSNNRKTAQKLGRLLRLNPDDTAGVHILCYRNTVDEDWVRSALSHLNQEKIIWLN